eukprot:Protomagalhaensia_wolfi_Nauph_80__3762@NODE_3804_length_705_cov_1262_360360_g3002_i0_p1_GENE_NODE_3804_length_705_cov_1262_360360_g3002_i0NODE_3804_length_705_cov_1262_360360_g3002_i0_p1_ORF_typecomplete_len173_score31_42Ribosomal_L18/PF17135_4/1_8e52Ribosomal_L27A/PF00828_19/0_00031Ribosomal_L27A/PF00828_19/1_8e04_NODE_3804_length_705_cov_1262_360360_g3002_i098616
MAIDIPRKVRRQRKSGRTHIHSTNPQVQLLGKLYDFLARRTDSKFNTTIAKRLRMSKRNKPCISLLGLRHRMKEHPGKVAVIVATVTNDDRVMKMTPMTVCALRFTETARARITQAGGECLTFDQLALRAPLGNGCALLKGNKNRLADKYFGPAPGLKGSHTRSRACCKTSR